MSSGSNSKSKELSPAMMRLPPSPEMVNIKAGHLRIPEFSLNDDDVLHQGSLSKNAVRFETKGNHQHVQHRLRSVAKYNAFDPQTLACSNDTLSIESSQDFCGPTSLGAIAGPRGVALFRLSRPHIPLLLFSHATNYPSSNRNSFKSLNSISSIAFQPTNSIGTSTNPSTLYLAAARGSGVLIWDASGHSPNPLLGRLLNDTTNDTRRDSASHITSISWMPGSNRNSSGSNPLLATTTASSLSMWDLRCHQTSGLFQPSLRFSCSRNANVAATSSLLPASRIVQVACSSCSEECATIDMSGVVRTYDLRKTDGGSHSSVGHPLSVFVAHEAGVGIDHLSKTCDGRDAVESAWVTWGMETSTPSAIVKVWGKAKSTMYYDDSSDIAASNDDKEDYWFMGDDSQKTPSTKNYTSMTASEYQPIAQYARPNMCCARVCTSPVNDSLVVVGYLDSNTLDQPKDRNTGWWAELLKLSPASNLRNEVEESKVAMERRGDFGLEGIASFSGGAANADVDRKSLTSLLGNADVGRLQAAELAFSTLMIPSDATEVKTEDEARIELLLCCLSDTGVLTTTAIPEALPINQGDENRRGDTSPQRSLTRSNIIRTAFASSLNQARVFPENKEGSSLIDIASIWGASNSTTADRITNRDSDKIIEKPRSASPLKVSMAREDSLRNNNGRRQDGFMPFDMDVPVPVPVAYNSVAAGNLNGIQLGMTEMTPLSAVINTTEDGIESKLNSTSIMENIDMERVPCPRLCGAVFGSGNGRLTIFRNGEVKKMWNWYQRTDTIRLTSIPSGQVDVTSSSDAQTLITDTKVATDPAKRYQLGSSTGPRTMKELVDMVSSAQEAQWGEANDGSGAEDVMSTMDNFFEDDSLESNSDDSGDDEESAGDTDEITKRYFGGRAWKGYPELGSSMIHSQSIETSRQVFHRSIAPSSDMLQPKVTVNAIFDENQGIFLAKGWKLGRWGDSSMLVNTDHDPESSNNHTQIHKQESIRVKELKVIHQLCLHNAGISKKCNETEKEDVWNLFAETALTAMNVDGEMFGGWGGNQGGALGVDMINNFFLYYEALGDVQMLATMFCVFMKGPSLLPKSREEVHNTYIIRYAELLYSWGLLNVRAELNKHLQQNYVQNDFKFESTEERKEEVLDLGVDISCPVCESSVDSRTNYCQSCKDFAFRCSICDTRVAGAFTFCKICKHGGHLRHMVNWFSKNSFCPTGCGCQCQLSPVLHSKSESENKEIF